MLNFLKKMIDLYSVGPDKTHFAIVAYSNWARVEFHLNTLTGASLTSQGYKELVDKIRFQRGFTFIDKALLVADKDVFTTARGMRPELPQVRLSSSFLFCVYQSYEKLTRAKGGRGGVEEDGKSLTRFLVPSNLWHDRNVSSEIPRR